MNSQKCQGASANRNDRCCGRHRGANVEQTVIAQPKHTSRVSSHDPFGLNLSGLWMSHFGYFDSSCFVSWQLSHFVCRTRSHQMTPHVELEKRNIKYTAMGFTLILSHKLQYVEVWSWYTHEGVCYSSHEYFVFNLCEAIWADLLKCAVPCMM